MSLRGLIASVALGAVVGLVTLGGDSREAQARTAVGTRGPLHVLRSNPRYFADRTGRAVYLTGSHVWWNLVGSHTWRTDCKNGAVRPFAFDEYLRQLSANGDNITRLWTIEVPTWQECGVRVSVGPLPWRRTGPGRGLDGRPKFDLSRFDPSYYRRLRARVRAARARGIYVSVMLFEGWGLQNHGFWRWRSHPFNRANNVNGIDGDLNHDGTGTEIQTLRQRAVTAIQDRHVRKVVETVGNFDNVLYEIVNESGPYSTPWQYHMIALVKRLEARRRFRHPVGMTFQHSGGSNTALYRSRAAWISPHWSSELSDPPTASGKKVVLADTDHLCGLCVDAGFPWKAFLRGNNVLFMDEQLRTRESQAMHIAMGQVRRYALRFNLAAARPRGQLSSTRYCLTDSRREYLVYQPTTGPFDVDLRTTNGELTVEWFEPAADRRSAGGSVAGGAVRSFTPPFGGPAVLYLRKS
jgi:collagenase-like protein with putative collagen-binding domain